MGFGGGSGWGIKNRKSFCEHKTELGQRDYTFSGSSQHKNWQSKNIIFSFFAIYIKSGSSNIYFPYLHKIIND